jgi:hypothetical protein
MARPPLSRSQRESLAHAVRAWLAGDGLELDDRGWVRSRSAGERVTLASLERRGWLERRAWRGDGVSRDSAFEYRLTHRARALAEGEQRRRRLAVDAALHGVSFETAAGERVAPDDVAGDNPPNG